MDYNFYDIKNKKTNVVCLQNGILFSQKKEVLIHVTAWITLENIVSERSCRKRLCNVLLHLYKISRSGISTNVESRLVVDRLDLSGSEWRQEWGVSD